MQILHYIPAIVRCKGQSIILTDHVLCSTALTTICFVNETLQFSIRYKINTLQPIAKKSVRNNYVVVPYCCAKFAADLYMEVSGQMSEILEKSIYLYSRTEVRLLDRFSRLIDGWNDADSCNYVPFWRFVDTAFHL